MKGHIRKRGQSSWAIVLDLGRDANGKRRQKWHTVLGNKREAQRELTRLLHEMNTGAYVEPTRMLVRDYLEKWLAHAKSKVAGKTFERYEEIVRKHLIPALGHHPLAKLQPLQIQQYYAEALESARLDGKAGGLSAQTVLHHHRVLHRALRLAVQWLLLARNPADAVESPRPEPKQIPVLDEAEATTLLAALRDTRLYEPTLMALASGLRRGELMALHWQDVDLDAGKVIVRRSLQQTREGVTAKEPKSGKGRTVALPALAVRCLRTLKARQAETRLSLGPAYEDNGLVFARADGRVWEPNSFSSAFAAAVRKSGLPHVNFHALRHSHATILLKRGTNPKIVSERLGHARVGTTLDIYSHVLPGMQEEAARSIDAAFKAAIEP
jgi:integrase